MSGRSDGELFTNDEPEGRFRDLPPREAPRPVYQITVQAGPGVDETRALRHLLKALLRRLSLRCVDIRRVDP